MSNSSQFNETIGGSDSGRHGVLVLGMHRSGTSALTSLLATLGCDLPATLLPASEGNQDGHWESIKVYHLNDELLASAGSSWFDWQSISRSWYQSGDAHRFRDRAQTILRTEFASSNLFVLKDPRICRLVPFWLEVFKQTGVRPAFVLTVRRPEEVAASLNRRDGFDPAFVKLMWLRHVLDAERATRGLRRVFTSYDQLIRSPDQVVDGAQTLLGIDWPRLSDEIGRSKAQAAIKPSLRRFEIAPLPASPGGGEDWFDAAFGIFVRWAESGENSGDFAALDRLSFEFDKATPPFLPVVNAGMRDLLQLRALAAQSTQKDQAHLDQLNALRAEIAEANDQVNVTQNALARSLADVAVAEELRAREEEKVEAAAEQISSLRADLKELRGQNEALGCALARTEVERLGLLTDRQEALDRLSFRDGEIQKIRRALAENTEKLASNEVQINWLKEIVIALTDDLFGAPWWMKIWLTPIVRRRQAKRLARRSLFDTATYLAENSDVAEDRADALIHYLRHGIAEKRMGPLSRR